MKAIKHIFTVFTIIIFLINLLPSNTLGASENNGLSDDELVQLKGFAVKKTTTIDEINSHYGKPKAEGVSSFGGKSYSYADDSYTWYLYIETDASGKIVSFGCVGEGFKTQRFEYGDKNGLLVYQNEAIIRDKYSDELIGMYEYNYDTNVINEYWNKFKSDGKYLYDLQKHSIIVSKVIAKMNGREFPQTYTSEDLFYANELLKENGTDIYEYARKTGQTNYISIIMKRTDTKYNLIPNPVVLGHYTEGFYKSENYKYVLYDINLKDKETPLIYTSVLFIDPDFVEERNTVELTEREKKLLDEARKVYKQQSEHVDNANEFNKENGTQFEIEPVYDSLPLEAGKWNENALLASTDFLNVARVGMGLTPVELNKDMVDCAQHKAALVCYVNNYGEGGADHIFDKPDGVSDEFYNKAQSYMNENLYYGDIQKSVANALNDGGDPIKCGHRYNLLEPSYTEWGVGAVGSGDISVGWQGVHKLANNGNEYNSVELVAWPSNGIFPLNMITTDIGNWTAKFYKNYTVSEDTEVTIKCLNTGEVYEITKENKNDSGKMLNVVSERQLTFVDNTVSYSNGDVFEITLHNVKDSSGKLTDYTYRSVFKNLSQTSSSDIRDITVTPNSAVIGVGDTQKLKIKIEPEESVNIITMFSSSDEKVAIVRQDGLITAVGVGNATITIKCGDVTKEVNITVEKKLPFKDVSRDVWYYNSVKYCYENGIIMGTTDTTFSPNTNVTRGNLVTILWRMEGSPKVSGDISFPDVKTSDYYYEAVKWAEKTGVVHGYDTGKFGPNNYISREQLATILNNYAKYKKKDTSKKADLSTFTDNKKISSYAKEGVAWAVGNKVMSGKNEGTRVDPQGKATRAEAAAMIQNYCYNVGR